MIKQYKFSELVIWVNFGATIKYNNIIYWIKNKYVIVNNLKSCV